MSHIFESLQPALQLMGITSPSRPRGTGTFVNSIRMEKAEIGHSDVLCTCNERYITYRMYQTYQLVHI